MCWLEVRERVGSKKGSGGGSSRPSSPRAQSVFREESELLSLQHLFLPETNNSRILIGQYCTRMLASSSTCSVKPRLWQSGSAASSSARRRGPSQLLTPSFSPLSPKKPWQTDVPPFHSLSAQRQVQSEMTLTYSPILLSVSIRPNRHAEVEAGCSSSTTGLAGPSSRRTPRSDRVSAASSGPAPSSQHSVPSSDLRGSSGAGVFSSRRAGSSSSVDMQRLRLASRSTPGASSDHREIALSSTTLIPCSLNQSERCPHQRPCIRCGVHQGGSFSARRCRHGHSSSPASSLRVLPLHFQYCSPTNRHRTSFLSHGVHTLRVRPIRI